MFCNVCFFKQVEKMNEEHDLKCYMHVFSCSEPLFSGKWRTAQALPRTS